MITSVYFFFLTVWQSIQYVMWGKYFLFKKINHISLTWHHKGSKYAQVPKVLRYYINVSCNTIKINSCICKKLISRTLKRLHFLFQKMLIRSYFWYPLFVHNWESEKMQTKTCNFCLSNILHVQLCFGLNISYSKLSFSPPQIKYF